MVEQKKKRRRDSKELESNVGPTIDIISELNVKKKKRRIDVAKYEMKGKTKKMINVDLDVAMPDKKKKKKKKKMMKMMMKKRSVGGVDDDDVLGPTDDDVSQYDDFTPTGDDMADADVVNDYPEQAGFDMAKTDNDGGDLDIDGGPTADYVPDISSDSVSGTDSDGSSDGVSDTDTSSEDDHDEEITEVYVYTGDDEAVDGDDYDEPTGDDEGGGGDDYDEPTGDDEGKDDEENRREMLSKKKRKMRRVKEIVEGIKAVTETACESLLSVYFSSPPPPQKKKSVFFEMVNQCIEAKLAQLQHHYSDTGREEEEDPSMDLGHKVQVRNADDTTLVTANNQSLALNADDTTLVTANNQSLPLVPRPKPNWGDAPSGEAEIIMKIALAELNEKLSSQGIYEFVGGLHINAFVNKGTYCHINFNVRLVNDGKPRDYNPRAVFAELVHDNSEGFRVTVVERLIPDRHDRAPRLRGCRSCDTLPHRNVLRHGRLKKFNPGL